MIGCVITATVCANGEREDGRKETLADICLPVAHVRPGHCGNVTRGRGRGDWRVDGSVGSGRASTCEEERTVHWFGAYDGMRIFYSSSHADGSRAHADVTLQVVACLAPTTPYVLYSQLFSSRTNPDHYQGWRWGQWISLIYNGVAFIGILCTYFPERHSPVAKRPVRETLAEIDFVGAALSISGITLL